MSKWAFDPIGWSCYGARTLRRLRYLRAGARALSAALLVSAAMLSSAGCGPAQFMSQVNTKATDAVLAAKNARAAEYAPYEYTAATEYLMKAREEGAYAEYQIAIAYGRRAEELAVRARAIAEEKAAGRGGADAQTGKDDSKVDGSGLPLSAPASGGTL